MCWEGVWYRVMIYDLLIVDDQAGVRLFLSEAFSEDGYTVETASNGAEAVEKASARPPSLILLDFRMPGMGGLETLVELRKIVPDAPIVMITAFSDHDIIDEIKESGADYCINKPFDLHEIRALVKGLAKEEKGRNCVKQQPER
jgi:two-component system response regulator (stage 0 sporulation protein F)